MNASIESLRRRKWVIGLLLAAVFAACGLMGVWWREPSTQTLLGNARVAFARGDVAEAKRLSERVLARDPRSADALMLAAKSAVELRLPEEAASYLDQLPGADAGADSGSGSDWPGFVEGWHFAGELALEMGRVSKAEAAFRRVLSQAPRFLPANVRMAYLLGFEGRCWEAAPFLLASVQQGEFTLHHLVLLGASEPVIADVTLLKKSRNSMPSDLLPLIGLARNAFQQNDMSRAESLLREVVVGVPNSAEAHAALGRVLAASKTEELSDWQSRLCPGAEAHPDVWSVRGAWAESRSEPRAAVRFYAEAVRRDPNHRVANYRLGQLLVTLNEPERAAPFVERAARLREFVLLIDQIYAQPNALPLLKRAAELTDSLGRLWEAWGWSQIALRSSPESTWAREMAQRVRLKLHDQLPQTLVSENPAASFDLAAYELPQWYVAPLTNVAAASLASTGKPACGVKFENVAREAGIEFTYLNRPGTVVGDVRMLETTGGGVAVLDFDGNGFPDLHFTQGCRWPPSDDRDELQDQLFRNLGDGRFECVTQQAGVGDPRYGQGVTTGDYDNDGFPDLYVANIGANRLYHNNGDGTFSDVTIAAGVAGERWTTSCLMADLNGDSLPDLYDVTYLAAQSAATQVCRHGDEVRWCSPDAFEAEEDQVYLNLGDGRFENVTRSAGIALPSGKGLGIVAADFDGSGKLSLFIANDAVANFLFVNQTEPRGGSISFSEHGVATGLAYDRDGLPQACMGVAAGDANGDGLIDLFVTNYAEQSNTLYRQLTSHLFEDDTRRANLRDGSFAMLGFGTQFLDGELDGWPDLVLTNGHVFDQSYKGVPYAMSPQYYRNLGRARFEEVPGQSLGSFFEQKWLGRGLARLDWNRDGREDFVVSHMNSPAALVENRTPSCGHFLAVQVRGVASSRDAIGAVVEVVASERTWVQQLTAGDGYQASNERRLVFGLGAVTEIEELRIRWPSGVRHVFRGVSVDRDVWLIEGQPAVVQR